jgi:hypothetical protein
LNGDELRFGKVGKSVKSSRWDLSVIDAEVGQSISRNARFW